MASYTGQDIIDLLTKNRSILNWGQTHCGKTYSLWTLAQWLKDKNLGRLIVCDFDKKCESLVRKCMKEGLLDYLEIRRYSGSADTIEQSSKTGKSRNVWLEWMREHNRLYQLVDPNTKEWKKDLKDPPPGAVCIDTLSSFDELTTEFCLADMGHSLGDAGTHGMADYGTIISKINEMVNSLISLPCITILNAHDHILQHEKSGATQCIPYVTGRKFPFRLPGKFDISMYSVFEGGKYKWILKPDAAKYLKSVGTTTRDDITQPIDQDYRLLL